MRLPTGRRFRLIRSLAKSGCLEAGGGFSQHSTGSITPELTTETAF